MRGFNAPAHTCADSRLGGRVFQRLCSHLRNFAMVVFHRGTLPRGTLAVLMMIVMVLGLSRGQSAGLIASVCCTCIQCITMAV